ncbi:hypothetical protein [Trebonia sp.]|uniref:hypothetical protein n=1 Tax=Trebonia sp. TaxID=2767075 RepID=UPI002604CB94|nr:hypothetical protein [Trebonia sp.]
MYQPYPGGSQLPQPSFSRPPAPPSVVRAAQVMYVGAAASLIGIIIDILERHAIRNALATRKMAHPLTPSELTTDYHLVLGVFVVGGLISVGLWIWMAQSCKAGKSWARIVSTVLFALSTIDELLGAGLGGGGGVRIYGLLIWVIGLIAIILLWQRSSTAYFRPVPQY